MRSMTLKASEFDQVVMTLLQQEEIELVTLPTKTKSASGYRLITPAGPLTESVSETVSGSTDVSDTSGASASIDAAFESNPSVNVSARSDGFLTDLERAKPRK